jgi:predicted branched-subunit amino acid permease
MTSTSLRPAATRAAADRRAGARAAIPFVIGLTPFAVTVGAAVGTSEDPLAAWTGTLLLYGGSAQLAVLQVLGTGAPVWTAIVVGVLINARLVVYSGGLAPLWKGARPWATVLGAATIVEPTWAMAEHRLRTGGPRGAREHYAGAAAVLTVGWTAAVTVGTFVGRVDGLAAHLAVAVPLCLVVLVAPHLRLPGGVAAVVAAAVTAVVARAVVPGFEVLPAMAAAAAAGLLVERRRS